MCNIAAFKANRIVELIRRNIVHKEEENIISAYKSIVRPHLQHSIQTWQPYHKKDVAILEKIQTRATIR